MILVKTKGKYLIHRKDKKLKTLYNLNDNQLNAVTSKSNCILCVAGAGSGKTTVLTHRVSYLNECERVGGSSMLCLTFTRNAGKEMKERIIKLLGEEEGSKVFCNTFHAFCVSILKEWGYLIGYDKEFSIYDEDDKLSIIKNILVNLCIVQDTEKITKRNIENSIECIKHPEYSSSQYPGLKDYILAANEYRYKLKRNSAVDLDMLIIDALKLLKDFPKVKEYYHDKYEYMFVDEYQDINDEQDQLINAINPANLFAVGDVDQCIYEWREAKPEYILDFKKNYPQCEVIKLEDNYRSTNQIVTAANHLIKNNKQRIDKILIPHKASKDKVEYLTSENAIGEAEMIAKIIINKDKKRRFKDFAVLARTNYQIKPIADQLKQFRIPYQIINNNQDIFKQYDIKMILNVINAALNAKDDRTIKMIINFPQKVLSNEQLTKLELRCLQKEKNIYNGLRSFKFKSQSEINRVILNLYSIRKYFNTVSSNAADVFKYTAEILDLEKIYNDQGRTSKIENIKTAYEKILNWSNMEDNLKENTSISNFIKKQKIKDIQTQLELSNKKNAVKLMTVHAAKGLEFPIVFVAGMNQGIFPNKRSSIEEERRLFYVAITRAKEKLYITRSKTIDLRYLKMPVSIEKSQFIDELQG